MFQPVFSCFSPDAFFLPVFPPWTIPACLNGLLVRGGHQQVRRLASAAVEAERRDGVVVPPEKPGAAEVVTGDWSMLGAVFDFERSGQ